MKITISSLLCYTMGDFFVANGTNQTYMDYCEVESLSLASVNDIVEDLDYEAADRVYLY